MPHPVYLPDFFSGAKIFCFACDLPRCVRCGNNVRVNTDAAEVAESFTDGLGPMQRWGRDCELPETETVIFQRVADGESLKPVCKSRGWPYSVVAQWLHADEGRLARYDAALRIWVDSIAMETVAISDEQAVAVSKQGTEFDPDVPRDALRIKARQWAAEKLHRARYGQTLKVERSVSVVADAGLVGLAGDLLALIGRQERVVTALPNGLVPMATSDVI